VNIYLDIDGVLVGTKSPKEDCVKFLEYLLAHFPNSTYWLTTRCNRGENHADRPLYDVYPDELAKRVFATVQPTNWGDWKTNAIDFSQPFLWFDDDLFYVEKMALEKHGVLDCHIRMNPRDDSMMKQALGILQSRVDA
jgi:hypothetical protein